MKNKLLYLFGILLCLICLAFGLSACGGDNNNRGDGNEIPTPETPTHTHVLSLVLAKSADCVNSGNTAYYTCTCGKWFTDSNATTEITDKSSVVIGALGHTYSTKWSQSETQHWHECSVCGDKKDLENHTAGTAATETTAQVCTACDYVLTAPLGHTHKTVLVPAKAADCEVDGNIEYYTCACGKWFIDGNATTEIMDKQSVVLTATGHSYSSEWSYNSTQHWHAATCKHSDEKSDLENHNFQNEVCSICKYSVGLLTFKTLQLGEDDTVYGKVSNDTTAFSFLKEVTANNGVTYTVCTDMACTQTVPSKTVSLQVGDNTYYILSERGNDLTLFTVTIRRRPIYTITFQTSGTAVSSQSVEEDGFAVQPDETTKTGYSFDDWTYGGEVVSFPYTVTESITFTAEFTANKYTATLDVNGGDSLAKSEFTATSDELFTFVTPTRTGYTFLGWYDGETKVTDKKWNYAEDKTFTAKWQANTYSVALNTNNTSAGTVSGDGKYDYDKTVTIIATTYMGYRFVGWYDSANNFISEKSNYTFNMGFDIAYTAKWVNREEMSNFTFASTETTLTITGIHDKTYTEIIIPNGVTSIGANAFKAYTTLTSVTMPDSVTAIGDSAFQNCQGLTGITIPDSVITIGYAAFRYCQGLTDITIPDSVTTIGSSAFDGCYGLESITLPFIGANKNGTNNTNFGYIFGASSYSSHSENIPTSLKTVIITGGECIDNSAFRNCKSLTNITIPDSVNYIGNNAFANCSGLTSVIIGNGVTSIGSEAFSNCGELTSVNIGSSVTSIGSNAFYYCTALASIIIPNSVTSIGIKTFYWCISLKSITLGNGVTFIGDDAFYYCSLTNVYITDIAAWCGITFSNAYSTPLYYAYNLYLNNELVKTLIIPDSVTSIGNYAFNNCRWIESAILGNSVTSIGNSAFNGCISLTSVYYKNTADDLLEISIGNNNTYFTNAICYYYVEEEPIESGNYWHYGLNGEIVVWIKEN